MKSIRFRMLVTLALSATGCTVAGCALPSQTQGQHGGTTVMLVGLWARETNDQHATTLGCARETIAWAAKEGSELVIAPVGLPGEEQWITANFALQTSAQRTNPFAAKRWQGKQRSVAENGLMTMERQASQEESLDLLAAATDGSRLLNYRRGPRVLILCASAQQVSPEFTIGNAPMSQHAIQRALYSLESKLEPMRLTRVVFGAAGDAEQTGQSFTEQATHEAFWRAWAHHEGAIHFAWGPIPHFPY
ncbi:MAG TPA: hypothetical protein VGL68_06340 [Solirubrobacteraceae bacterium]|jgi:hypothetical protein